jgi:demethylmenaquinone methyltransferase/2-methoxy-6-polyprenyl-1,4-benzoquinol methylase
MPKKLPDPENKRDYVREMFTRISTRYDLMNRIMTFGQDAVWRRQVVALLHPQDQETYVDLGAGTGDLSVAIRQISPETQIIAVDLTMAMVRRGREKTKDLGISWIIADAQALPFADRSFTGIVTGYLLRNVSDIDSALSEQFRVTRPAGNLVSLDTTPPVGNVFYPLIYFYLKWVIPLIGKLVTGDTAAYKYLPESTRNHLPAEKLAEKMVNAGYKTVFFRKLMFGSMAIHTAQKQL